MLPLLWQGCSQEDFNLDNPTDEDFQGITVRIPYVEPEAKLSESTRAALTRAGQYTDFSPEEAEINQLYIFAFSNGLTGVSKAIKLDKAGLADWTTKDNYKNINMKLEIGEYHVYVVANVDIPNYETISEDDLKNLDIAAACGGLSDFSKGLPMSCSPSEIVSGNGNYVKVEVGNNPTKVKANLKFAVSKVKVSVVNNVDKIKVENLTVKNIADKLNVFIAKGGDPTENEWDKPVKSLGAYYDLPGMSGTKFDVENLGNAIGENPTNEGSWVWQAVFYVPERITPNTTSMELSITNKTKEYRLGAKNGVDYTLNRSQYYRYYIEPNSGEITMQVIPWSVESIVASIGGPVTLDVDKTDLGVISGTETAMIKYSSNVDVDREIPIYMVDGQPVEVFIISDKPDENGNYTVSVNGKLGIRSEEEMEGYDYFYLVAGPLKKKITVKPDLKPYLKVTPESYTVIMKEIANEMEYSVEYSYSTNMESLVYAQGEGSNDQAKNDLLYYNVTSEGSSTAEVRPGNGDKLGFEGKIVVKFNEPYNPVKFQKESNINYKFTATEDGWPTLTESVKLNIIPNLNGYRLWFRDVNDSWDDVHVYIYQPLQWYHPLSGNAGELVDVKCYKDAAGMEDALLYSVTGKKTFKGWDVCNIKPGQNSDWDNAYVYEDLYLGKGDQTQYYDETDFLETWRNGLTCEKCKGSNYARRWPGIQMKKITDPASPQYMWWYIDIPPICQPGKALIMFTKGHYDSGENVGCGERYPVHMVPGIPLYDFPDREGWMAYDSTKGTNGNGNEFVDDQPSVIAPLPTEYDYYIRGSFTSSDWTDHKLVNGKVTITSTQAASFGIKLTQQGKNDQVKWYASSGSADITLDSPMEVKVDGKNWDGLAAGTWTFTFDKVNMTLTISGTESGGGGNQGNDEMVTIYLLKCNDQSDWGVPYAYCYINDDNKNAPWPGQPMEQVAGQDGWYKLSVNKNLTTVIFSDNGANQLATVAIRPDGKYYSDNITFSEHTWE